MTTTPTPMQPPAPHANRARAGTRRCNVRGRGSAVILVIVSIVLMAILGATFVQVARFERVTPGGEHIDIAIDSVLNEVAIVLAQDLYADNGDFFNPELLNPTPGTTNGGGDEPYDYPWTNGAVAQWPVVFLNSNPGVAEGGVGDDPWLASTSFNGLSNDGSAAPNPLVWGHISNLTGKFLDNADRDLTGYMMTNPGEIASTAALTTDVIAVGAGANPRLVDSDGDGIGDSLWAYAPAAEIAGKRYVYAIRIVDLSARVNVNTATGQTNAAGTIPVNTTQSAHGDSPAEVDGLAVAYVFGGGGTGHGEFAQTIGRRTGVLNPNWGDADQERRHYWLNGASVVDASLNNRADVMAHPNYDPNNAYTEGDLFELLYRGGLNNTGVDSQLEQDMPNTLRAGSGTETFWGDVYGSEGAYMANNARLQFTTASGGVVFAPGVTTMAGDPTLQTAAFERVLQADINHSDKNALALNIVRSMNAGAFNFAASHGHLGDATNFGGQLALNIIDMRDPDNQLSDLANTRYGMEALPFISEVYVQRQYTWDGNGDPVPPTDFRMDFTASAPSDYAIEIHNPFDREISLENVHLAVGTNANVWDRLTDLGAPNTLAPGDYIVLYRDNTRTLTTGYLAGVPAAKLINLGVNAPNWPAAGPVQVQLQAEAQTPTGAGSDTPLGWPYCAVNADAVPANDFVVSTAAAPAGAGPDYYFQYSYQNTTGLDLVQVEPTDRDAAGSEPNTTYDTSMAEFGQTKSRFNTANLVGVWAGSVPAQQWLFLDKETAPSDNDGRIPYVGDVLTIPVVGPTPGATVAEQIAASGVRRLDSLMLDYRRTSTLRVDGSGTYDALNVPHAMLVLSRLTTHSPAVDGFDMDGDMASEATGVGDEDEAFVPGKINLNTATYDVLRSALPYPSAAMRDAVAQEIIDYRERTGRLAGSRNNPGVAYVGELYEEVFPAVNTTIGGAAGYVAWDWNNHQTSPDFSTAGTTRVDDGITGDREEDLMLSKWLDEVCSTRSDVFAVYLVVQGFPEGGFGNGPVESARVVAVFSRANVSQVGDKAQLIAVRRVE